MEVYFFKPRRSPAPRLRAEVTRATLTARWRAEFFFPKSPIKLAVEFENKNVSFAFLPIKSPIKAEKFSEAGGSYLRRYIYHNGVK